MANIAMHVRKIGLKIELDRQQFESKMETNLKYFKNKFDTKSHM